MTLAITIPKFQLKSISENFFGLSQSQIVGRAINDSSYNYQLQTSYDVMGKWITFFGKSYFRQAISRPDLDYYQEHKANTSGKFNFKKELVNYFLQAFSNKKEFLDIYNKLKQVFTTLEKLILVELYIFVSIITLYNQQFGGNRDLPVAFA